MIVETTGFDDACLHYPVMSAIERFEMEMRGVAGVQSVVSVPSLAKISIAAFNEGNPRWGALPRSSDGLTQGASAFDPDNGMNTENCQAIQVLIYTTDHEGKTIAHIVDEIKRLAAEDHTPNIAFRLAGGNVGVMAATNEAVGDAEVAMLLSIFGAIALLCFVTFRSWRAVLCIVVPLTVVSILCNAVMAWLGIGLKVATLPVITLGVGVGVDYGIYLYERLQHEVRGGATLARCVRGGDASTRHRGLVYRGDDVHRRGDVGVFRAQVPGGYGRAACLHVPRQPVRRGVSVAGAGGMAWRRAGGTACGRP